MTPAQPPGPSESPGHPQRRFERVRRLVGEEGMRRLSGSHVLVVGLGGVGSWAAESLARSGVGRLTLVDYDRVCVTNTNRQLAALAGTVGRPKCQVLAERLGQVNPQARVEGLETFYCASTSEALLGERPDFVLDAIDHITAKCHLLATCREQGLRIVTSTGASGRLDPTVVRVADLARTRVDPMALAVRKILRVKYGFPPKKAFAIPAVFSEEDPAMPLELSKDGHEAPQVEDLEPDNEFHSRARRSIRPMMPTSIAAIVPSGCTNRFPWCMSAWK